MNMRPNKFWDTLVRGLASLTLVAATLAVTALPSGTASANTSCTLGAWTTTTALPVALNSAASVVHNGYVYELGGTSTAGAYQSGVHYAAVGSDGTLGSWTTSPHSLPQVLGGLSAVVSGGYVYVMGGTNTGGDKSVVYYAQLASDGSVGTWSTSSNSLPVAANSSMAVTSNGYIYVMGGRAGNPTLTGVYYAHLNSDGSVGTWTTSPHVLPEGMAYGSTITFGGYVYAMGGYNYGANHNIANVYYAPLASDGSVGAWVTSSNPFPQVGTSGAAVVANGYSFEIRGGGNNNVYMSALNADGSTSTWSSATSLPTNLQAMTSVVHNGYLFVLGGYNSNPTTTVYKAPLTGDCASAPSSDLDGVVNSVEDAAPNAGDANNDQIQDGLQTNVTSLVNPVTSTYAALASTCAANVGVALASGASQPTTDTGYTYPAGLMDFSLDCTPGATATVTMYYYGLPLSANFIMRKYNPTTHSYAAIPGAVFTATTIGGQSATKVVYQLTDGGALDADGLANGVIVDPAGPAVLAASTTATAPSTGAHPLSPWSYVVAALLGLTLLAYLGRKYYLAPKTR